MPCKSYGIKKARSFAVVRTKTWGKNLKGNPRPRPMMKKK